MRKRLFAYVRRKPLQALAGLVFAGAMLALAFTAVDTLSLPVTSDVGVVVGKEYRPMSRHVVHNGGRSHTTLKPEAYLVHIEVGGLRGTRDVGRMAYEAAKEGEKVVVIFSEHRLTDNLRILEMDGLGDGM